MGDSMGSFSFKISRENDLTSKNYDGIIKLSWPEQKNDDKRLSDVLKTALELDSTLDEEITILPLAGVPAGRLVLSPTGKIDADYDDVRSLRDAAFKGMKRALKAGIKSPLFLLESHPSFENSELVTLLGVLESLHVPIQVRELKPENIPTIERLGIVCANKNADDIIALAKSLESGRILARDIGDADPERMAPPRVQEWVEKHLAGTNIKITTISDPKQIAKEYPLFEAVNRCASQVERHQGRIMFLEYNPNSTTIKETLFLVGKGVTYDTGGADIKFGGIMAGMSRDKCGAAAVAGFMKVLAELQPKDIKVVAGLSLVRNSVGSNCYVADELIKSRSGALVRVGNTDAEGRMVMADVLCRMKELALDAVNPHLFTVATLTGHAHLTVGVGYSIAMDNGPARKAGTSLRLQDGGDLIGDPFEISTIRREDMKYHKGVAAGDDVRQCNNVASSRTNRGHQGPAAFLLLASGLDKHGSGDEKPLKFSHLDIAGSGGDFPDPATGAPILALANAFLLQ